MNIKTWIPLIAAVVLGLVAAKLGRDMISRNSQSEQGSSQMAAIVVAADDLSPGHELTADDLAVSKIAADAATSGFSDPQQLVGRAVLSELVKGQPIYNGALAEVGAGSGLQALVPAGMRAITVEVNEFSGVAGMLVPGCIVDVIATIQNDGQTVARTIVEGVRVTAVGRKMGAAEAAAADVTQPEDLMRSVTLLTTPRDAEAIELAATTGQPRLVLRSNRDDAPSDSEGITLAELVGQSRVRQDPYIPLIELPRPATQPVTPATDTPPPTPVVRVRETSRRNVTIIRGGVPSDYQLEVRPAHAAGLRLLTGADTQSATH